MRAAVTSAAPVAAVLSLPASATRDLAPLQQARWLRVDEATSSPVAACMERIGIDSEVCAPRHREEWAGD